MALCAAGAQPITCNPRATSASRYARTSPVRMARYSVLADISFELYEMVAEENKVVARWKVQGTHIGEFMGVLPTKKQLELHGINIYSIVDGKIATNHEETNIPEVIQRLKMSH